MPKSAIAAPGERPEAKLHHESLRVDSDLLERPRRITIVDDFVTKGATLLAAASHVQEAFPEAEVQTFALVRTMGLVADIEAIGEPCEGLITRVCQRVDRQP